MTAMVPGLVAVVRSEALRLRRRSFALGIALMGVFAALITTLVFATASSDPAVVGPGMGQAATTLTALTDADGVVTFVTVAANLIGVIALSFWAIATASDHSSGLIRLLAQAEPRRWRLIVGKVVALTVWTAAGTALATAVGVGASYAMGAVVGVSTTAWGGGLLGTVVSSWVNLTVASLVWGMVGLALAAITRSQATAIGGGIAYLLIGEQLLTTISDVDWSWLPGQVMTAVSSGGTADMGYALALAVAAGYGVLAGAAAILRTVRSDIHD